MFYVSDITGAQTPYAEEVYRVQREQQLARAAEQTAELRAEQSTATEDIAASSQTAGSVQGVPGEGPSGNAASSGSRIGAVGAGVAGASALYRGREPAAASGETEEGHAGRGSRRPGPREPFPEDVSPVNPSRRIKQQVSPEDEQKMEPIEYHPNPYRRLDEAPNKRQPAMLASQIMSTPVLTVTPEDSAAKAHELFLAKRYRHVPVVSHEGKLVGILSDRDFLSEKPAEHLVKEFMTTHVLSARPGTEIRLIAQVLFQERIGGMPIVDEDEKLVGILTRSDILRTVVNQAPLELWV